MDRLTFSDAVRMLKHVYLVFSLTALTILGCSIASGQIQEGGFEAVVVEDNADMRAGETANFYSVGKLKKDDRVKVQAMVGGWYSIHPPTGVLSLIAKDQVTVTPGQNVGTVQGKDVPVKVLGMGGIGESYRQHATLNKGDTVQLVGEEGSFYKILPPRGALVYVGPGALRRVDVPAVVISAVASPPVASATATVAITVPATQPAAAATASPPATAPAPGAVSTAVIPATPDTPVKTPPVVLRSPTPSQTFAAAEEKFLQAMKLPLEKQPIDELLALYTSIGSGKHLLANEADMVTIRIAQLKRNAELAAGIKALEIARQKARELPPPPPAPKAVPVSRSMQDAKNYDLVGMLLASGVYDGDRLPRLYRVVEPATLRTVAYVRPGKAIDSHAHLGRVVGMMGTGKLDEAMKITIFEVRSLDVLEAIPPAPASAPTNAPPADAQPMK